MLRLLEEMEVGSQERELLSEGARWLGPPWRDQTRRPAPHLHSTHSRKLQALTRTHAHVRSHMSSYTGSNSSSGGGGGGSGAAQGPSPATSSLAKHHASANSLRAVAARTAASGALSPLSSSSVSLSSATGARPAQLQAPGVRSKASPAAPTTALAPAPAAGARQTTSEGTDAAVWRSSAAKRAEKAWALQSEKSESHRYLSGTRTWTP